MTRRGAAWGLLAAALGLLLWALAIEPARLVERQETIRVAGLPSMTIALLSDIHAGCHFVDEAKIRRVVAIINAWRPDVVALLGDYVTENRLASPIPAEQTARWLGDLRAPGGVFAVLGNHDWWHDGPGIRRAFEDAGIRVLEGESAAIQVRGQPLRILGVPDHTTRRDHIAPTLATAPADAPVIALTHSPDVFPGMPPRVRLTLAGHTHGGQVRLPLLGALVVPSRYKQRYVHGHVAEEGRHLYVTSGLGMSIFPVRFGVPPEVVLLRINP
jgi:predicted MPP superfamily phosphohydrolase